MPQQAQPAQEPPPRPPLPPELATPSAQPYPPHSSAFQSPQPVSQVPPPPPPKPGQLSSAEGPQQQFAQAQNTPPPVPPLPPKAQNNHQPISPIQGFSTRAPPYSHHQGSIPRAYPPPQQRNGPHPGSAYAPSPTYHQPANGSNNIPLRQQPPQPEIPQVPRPPYNQYPIQVHQTQSHPPHPARPQAAPTIQPAPQPKPAAEDLLTSPFELDLPSFTPTGPPPPIPPNPEKDALLQAVSKALTETLQSNITHSKSAAHSLTSQSHSLYAAISTLQAEISSLTTLNSNLESNSSILSQSLHRADAVIADAKSRVSSTHPTSSSDPSSSSPGLPAIDEILVAPTVVGKQLYDLVAEERGIQQAIYALQAALVKGIISVETWSRHTRGLAREAFLKRALIRKIGRGMGLEEF